MRPREQVSAASAVVRDLAGVRLISSAGEDVTPREVPPPGPSAMEVEGAALREEMKAMREALHTLAGTLAAVGEEVRASRAGAQAAVEQSAALQAAVVRALAKVEAAALAPVTVTPIYDASGKIIGGTRTAALTKD